MREIKFRAWDGEKYISPDYITRDGVAHWKEDSIPTRSTIIEQFTGLHDKNGKEIYEGDLMRSSFPSRIDIPDSIQIVEWCERDASFFAIDKAEFRLGGKLHPVWWNTHCEVIGNIHENPELLK